MAKTLNVTLLIRNDPANVWIENNPVLSKGEMGVEIDTRRFKIGDGVSSWVALKYASGGSVEIKTTSPTTTDIDYDIGTIWLNTDTNKVFVLFAKTSTATWIQILTPNDIGVVSEAVVAQKLKTARTLQIIGDAAATATFDGSNNAILDLVFANSGAAAGTYTKLTINAKGIVTNAEQLVATDIPNITLSKINDAGTAASRDVGTSAGQVPLLDGDGKLATSVLPALAIVDVHEVASEAEMLALDAQKGDFAIRSDESRVYILKQEPASVLDNWVLLQTPANAVLSVNGKTGVVTLTTSDIAEGSNLYFTETRATSNFNTNFASKRVSDLQDGSTVVTIADTLVLDGGNA